MKILVCGGREWRNYNFVDCILTLAHSKNPIDLLIHGGCRGVDTLAGQWALAKGIHQAAVPALWDYYRKQGRHAVAGALRNEAMLILKPDGVIAFPGGAGTADMVRRARKAGIKVWEPKP